MSKKTSFVLIVVFLGGMLSLILYKAYFIESRLTPLSPKDFVFKEDKKIPKPEAVAGSEWIRFNREQKKAVFVFYHTLASQIDEAIVFYAESLERMLKEDGKDIEIDLDSVDSEISFGASKFNDKLKIEVWVKVVSTDEPYGILEELILKPMPVYKKTWQKCPPYFSKEMRNAVMEASSKVAEAVTVRAAMNTVGKLND